MFERTSFVSCRRSQPTLRRDLVPSPPPPAPRQADPVGPIGALAGRCEPWQRCRHRAGSIHHRHRNRRRCRVTAARPLVDRAAGRSPGVGSGRQAGRLRPMVDQAADPEPSRVDQTPPRRRAAPSPSPAPPEGPAGPITAAVRCWRGVGGCRGRRPPSGPTTFPGRRRARPGHPSALSPTTHHHRPGGGGGGRPHRCRVGRRPDHRAGRRRRRDRGGVLLPDRRRHRMGVRHHRGDGPPAGRADRRRKTRRRRLLGAFGRGGRGAGQHRPPDRWAAGGEVEDRLPRRSLLGPA